MNRQRMITTTIGLVLFGSIARAQAQSSDDQNTDDKWDGPGYYAEDLVTTTATGAQDLYKAGGPFGSNDDCQTYLQQFDKLSNTDTLSHSYQCVYRSSDPNYTVPVGCFLTTACVEHAGLPDDCAELTVMRAFRDGYLSTFEEGRLLIDHYYRIAPRIVERIRRAPDRSRVLDWVLREVRSTAGSIGRGDSEAAIERYAAMVLRLQQHYAITR